MSVKSGQAHFIGIGAAVLVQPVAGAISDEARLEDRRKPFIVPSASVMLAALLLLAILPGFWWLLVTYVALQVASNVAQAAFQALVPDLVPSEDVGEASGVKTGFDLVGTLIGLGAVGLLIALGWSDRQVIPVLAAVLAAGTAAVWLLVPKIPGRQQREGQGWSHLVTTAYEPLLRGTSEFRTALLARFLFLLGLYPVQRFLLYFLEDRFEVEDPVTQASLAIFAAVTLGAVAAAVAGALSDHVGRNKILASSVVCTAAGVLGVALLPSLLLVGLAGGLIAVGAGAFQAANWAAIADTIPEGEGARYFGVANMTTAGASAAVGLLGPVVDVLDRFVPDVTYPATFALGGLFMLAALWPVSTATTQRH